LGQTYVVTIGQAQKSDSGVKRNEASQLLEQVEAYKPEYKSSVTGLTWIQCTGVEGQVRTPE